MSTTFVVEQDEHNNCGRNKTTTEITVEEDYHNVCGEIRCCSDRCCHALANLFTPYWGAFSEGLTARLQFSMFLLCADMFSCGSQR